MSVSDRWREARRMGREGVFFAKAYSILAIIVLFVNGPQLLASHPWSIVALLVTYAVGCVGAGIVVGFALPLTRVFPGRFIVAFLALLPISVGFGLVDLEGKMPTNFYSEVLEPALIFAGIMGSILALYSWLRGFGR